MKELDDFARPRLTLLPLAGTAPPVHLRLMILMILVRKVKNLINKRLGDIAALRKGLHPVKDIPLLKPPFEAGCGEMMLREKSE